MVRYERYLKTKCARGHSWVCQSNIKINLSQRSVLIFNQVSQMKNSLPKFIFFCCPLSYTFCKIFGSNKPPWRCWCGFRDSLSIWPAGQQEFTCIVAFSWPSDPCPRVGPANKMMNASFTIFTNILCWVKLTFPIKMFSMTGKAFENSYHQAFYLWYDVLQWLIPTCGVWGVLCCQRAHGGKLENIKRNGKQSVGQINKQLKSLHQKQRKNPHC